MSNGIFDKADKGRKEIATRQYRLAPRLRTLLVLINGKQTQEELLKKVSGIGLNEDSITELLDKGFICPVELPVTAPAAVEESTAPVVNDTISSDQDQFLALYRFYTETIKSAIGLRGYTLQLKVEKAASIDDFRQLRKPYLDAVLRAKGTEMARERAGQLDQLLSTGQAAPQSE